MKNQFTRTLRELRLFALVLTSLVVFLAAIPKASFAQVDQVDIGIFQSQTNLNEVEIKVRPNYSTTLTMTNMQFTVKWADNLGVTITPGAAIFPYNLTLQGSVVTSGGYNYAVFASSGGFAMSWTANTEYIAAKFTFNTCAPFEIGNDAWTNANNGVWYAEVLGFDRTGTIYNSPVVCISPLPNNAINPTPGNGDTAQYSGANINVGWQFIKDPAFTAPDSFRVNIAGMVYTFPYVAGQTNYTNMISYAFPNLTNVSWSVTPFNASGNASGVTTWSFLTAPSPLTVDVTGTAAICNGASTGLNATPAGGVTPYTFAWTPQTGLSNPAIANPTASPTATTVYTLVVTDAWGATASGTATVTVNPLPTANAGSNTSLCTGGCVTLLATGGVSYAWSNAVNTANNDVCPTVTTTYTVTVTDANQCSATDDVTVTVNPLPAANAGQDQSICAGSCAQLTATGGIAYAWSNQASGASIQVCPTATTTYTVTVTDLNGCTAADAVVVTVNPLPAANAGQDVSVCVGACANLMASPAGMNYLWSTGATTADIQVCPATTTTYSLTVTDANGCSAADGVVVTVNPLPTANAGQDVTICAGTCTGLTATGGVSYVWSNQATGASIQVCPTTATTYTVTVTDINGCTATDAVVVGVNSLPTANAGQDATICAGACASLTATGGVAYAWSNQATGASIQVCPSQTTTYTVTVTDANGCTDDDNVTVTVNSTVVANAGADVSVCAGDCANLLASGGVNFAWSNGATAAATQVCPASTTTYTVTVSDASGCSASDDVVVTVNPLPTANAGQDATICAGGCTQLLATGGVSYVWSNQATSADIQVCPSATTTYSVTVTDANGCSSDDQVTVTVNALPTADAGQDVSICAGGCASLTATGGVAYVWSNQATGASIQVCPTATTTYTVTVTDANGCTAVDAVVVTVNQVTNVSATATPPAICTGQTSTLTATGAATYVWDQGLGSGATINVSPLTSTTYNVTGTDINGCTGNASVTVTVGLSATITQQPVDQGINLGSNATFSVVASNAASYQWQISTNGGASWANLSNNAIYSGVTTANLNILSVTLNLDGYMYKVVMGSPCGPAVVSNSATLTVIQPPVTVIVPNVTSCTDPIVIPVILVKAIGVGAISLVLNYDDQVLVFDTIQNIHPQTQNGFYFTVNASGGKVYISWHSVSPLNILFDTLVELVFHSPNGGFSNLSWDLVTPGNCELADVNLNPLSSVTYIAGNVTAVPSPVITADPADVDITEGQNASFSITATNAMNYQWQVSINNGTTWTNLANGAPYSGVNTSTLTITNATVYMDNYRYRSIVGGMCSPNDVSDDAFLNVRPIITTYIGNLVACADTVIVPVYVTHFFGVSDISLTLGFNSTMMNYVGLASKNAALNAGTFFINSSNGRVYVSWYNITPINLGDVLLLELKFTSNGGYDNLIWDVSVIDNCQYNNENSEIIQSVFINGTITINPLPLAYSVTGGGQYCSGGMGVMVGLANSQTGRTYSLYRNGVATGDVLAGIGSALSFGNKTLAGTYTVKAVVNSTGCSRMMTGSAVVVINPLPIVNAGSDVSILSGTSTTINATVSGGTPGYTYAWTPGGYITEDITVSPASTTTYVLTGTDTKGCFATDNVKVTVYYNTISGNVNYDNSASTPLTNVTVSLVNKTTHAVVATDVTDASGYYEFGPVANGSYTVKASSTKPWGGVNSTDALAIMEHFIQLNPLSGLRLRAADVDASGFVNTVDAYATAQRFVQLITSFNAGDWVFDTLDVVLASNDYITANLKGLCYGDVNGSHIPAAKQTTTLSLNNKGVRSVKSNSTFELPVNVDRNVEVGAVSLVLDIPAYLGVKNVKMNSDNGKASYSFSNGQLRISWYSTAPMSLSAGDAIATLTLVATSLPSEIEINLGNESELADAFAHVINYVDLTTPKLISTSSPASLTLTNYPNPFSGKTNILYELPVAGKVTVVVYNLLGDKVASLVNEYQAEGAYKVEFNANGLVPGIYQYRIDVQGVETLTQTKTMVVTE